MWRPTHNDMHMRAPRRGVVAFKCYETQSPLGLPLTTPCSGADATALYTRARLPLRSGGGAQCDATCDEEGAEVRGRGVDGGAACGTIRYSWRNRPPFGACVEKFVTSGKRGSERGPRAQHSFSTKRAGVQVAARANSYFPTQRYRVEFVGEPAAPARARSPRVLARWRCQ